MTPIRYRDLLADLTEWTVLADDILARSPWPMPRLLAEFRQHMGRPMWAADIEDLDDFRAWLAVGAKGADIGEDPLEFLDYLELCNLVEQFDDLAEFDEVEDWSYRALALAALAELGAIGGAR